MRSICLAVAVLATVFAASGKINIGEKITAFPSPVWLDGKGRSMTDFLQEKKFAVLYFWQADQHSLSDFPRISGIAEKFRAQVAFAGIAPGSVEKLKRFPGAVRLGFPVNADENGTVTEKWEVKSSRMPLAWIVDKNGTLLWQGRSFQLPGVLNLCLDGKFDLMEEIRKDRFAQAVNSAVKAGEIEKAVSLLHQEWLKNPAGMELLEAQMALLTRRLKRVDDAFALVHNAQQKNPGDHRFYEMEYKLLADPAQEKRLPEFFQRVMREFPRKPEVLMAFAAAEMGRPAETLNMPLVLKLADAGWRSQAFKDDVAKGRYAIEYAKIVHAAGRVDLACKLSQTAYKLFEKEHKMQQGAKKAVLYYGKMSVAGQSITVADLQK